MTEQLPEPRPPRIYAAPVDVTPELARKNVLLALGLAVLVLLIFGGSIAIAFAYLHYS